MSVGGTLSFAWAVHGASWQRGPHFQIQGISRVLRETHFPWSVLKGKAGFRLLSSRNGQRRRRHGPKDSISFFGKKSSLFHQKSIFQRDFTVTPYRPTATLCTPNFESNAYPSQNLIVGRIIERHPKKIQNEPFCHLCRFFRRLSSNAP